MVNNKKGTITARRQAFLAMGMVAGFHEINNKKIMRHEPGSRGPDRKHQSKKAWRASH